MGGYGSVNWCRSGAQLYTEDCKSIDIRLMKRKGSLISGYSGALL